MVIMWALLDKVSQLFIRTNDIPPEVSVPVDKEQAFHVQSPLQNG